MNQRQYVELRHRKPKRRANLVINEDGNIIASGELSWLQGKSWETVRPLLEALDWVVVCQD